MSDDVGKIAPALRGRNIETLRRLSNEDWKLAATIMSCGVPPLRIAEVLRAYSPNREYDVAPAGAGAGKRVILAYSFVRDRNQYLHTYGQSDVWAGEMRGLLDRDPSAAMKEIAAVVNARLAARGSSALAVVEHGQPRGSPGAAATGGASDVNYPPLQQAMVRYSAQAGVYNFVAEDDGSPGPHRFTVDLGGGLHTAAQRKATAIMAARLVRVLGREDPVVVPYIGYKDNDDDWLWGADVEDDAPDGRIRPRRDSRESAPGPKTPSPAARKAKSPSAADGGSVGKLAEELAAASLEAAKAAEAGKG
nr:PAS-rich protein [Metarhizium anisopliae polymycovirus 1]